MEKNEMLNKLKEVGVVEYYTTYQFAEKAQKNDRFMLGGANGVKFGAIKDHVYTVVEVVTDNSDKERVDFTIRYKRYRGQKVRELNTRRSMYSVLVFPEKLYKGLEFYRADQIKRSEITFAE
jgi:hypothetical protein